jgi:DNA-binding LytR/AlgR family response regulator
VGLVAIVAQILLLAATEILLGRSSEPLIPTALNLGSRKLGVSLLAVAFLFAAGHVERLARDRRGVRGEAVDTAASALIKKGIPHTTRREPITIRAADGVNLVHPNTVDWIEAAGNYIVIHVGEHRHVARSTLTGILELLGGDFVKVSRSAAVNLERVCGTHGRTAHGDLCVRLTTGASVKVSRTHRQALLLRLPKPL